MDSLSHTAMGAGLAAMALTYPELLTDSTTGVEPSRIWIVFVTFIVAAFFPDIDVILKPLGQSKFLKIHRAMSHSILVVALSSLAITLVFRNIMPEVVFWKALIWMAIAVGTHVVMDIFNNYGTQALWPFKKKWYALSYTNTADTIIHVLYAIAFAFYGYLYLHDGFDVAVHSGVYIFGIVSILIVGYLVSIYFTRMKLNGKLREKYSDKTIQKITIVSRMLPHKFKYIVETPECYYVGFINGKELEEHDQKIKDRRLPERYYDIIKKDPAHKNFTSFSPVFYWHEEAMPNGALRIKYTDLRYLDENKHYSFNLVFDFDEKMNYVKHIGWVFNQPALERKMARKRLLSFITGHKNVEKEEGEEWKKSQ